MQEIQSIALRFLKYSDAQTVAGLIVKHLTEKSGQHPYGLFLNSTGNQGKAFVFTVFNITLVVRVELHYATEGINNTAELKTYVINPISGEYDEIHSQSFSISALETNRKLISQTFDNYINDALLKFEGYLVATKTVIAIG